MADVVTKAGTVRGRTVIAGINAFLGIPYGGSTGGANRFRPPAPVEPWSGVRDATAYGASAPQAVIEQSEPLKMFGGIPEPSMSEDCLYLNVWTPGLDGGQRPVFVYFHGGGHSMGSGTWPAYDGTAMATRDVVVITVNHRLGILGYLSLQHLLGADYESSGANGLLDLVAALQWVRDNISEFGGDPGNVTICGESGGGSKVAGLLTMPSAQGLFHRAAIMSGWFGMLGATPGDAVAVTEGVLTHLGLDAGDAAQLLELPAPELVKVAEAMGGLASGILPVVDGTVIVDQPLEMVRSGRAAKVPLIIGSTRDEYAMFLGFIVMMAEGSREDAALGYLRHSFGSDVDNVIAEYRKSRPTAPTYDVYEAVATDGNVRMPAIRMAEAATASGWPTFMYRFDWESPLDPSLKAAHGLDVPFLFDTPDTASATGTGDERCGLANDVCGAFTTFARTGEPVLPSGTPWLPYSADQRHTMLFNIPSSVATDPSADDRQAWSTVL